VFRWSERGRRTEHDMSSDIMKITLALLVALTGMRAPAHAGSAAQCAATKQRIAGRAAAALAKCDVHAVAKGAAAAPDCVSRARGKFAAAWSKTERAGGCSTTGDDGAIEGKVDVAVTALEDELQATGPASHCSAAKFGDAGRDAACELGCTARAALHSLPITGADAVACRARCTDRLETTFPRREARGDCHTTGDAGAIEAGIAAFVDDVSAELTPVVVTTTTIGSGPVTTTTVAAAPGGLFETSNPWNTSVATHPKAAVSDAVIQALAAAGGWGSGVLRIDFGIEVLTGDASTPFLSFTPTGDFYTPDCDHVPFPVPPGGAIEGESGYACGPTSRWRRCPPTGRASWRAPSSSTACSSPTAARSRSPHRAIASRRTSGPTSASTRARCRAWP
jgi:hypothetical protein